MKEGCLSTSAELYAAAQHANYCRLSGIACTGPVGNNVKHRQMEMNVSYMQI